MSGSTRTRTSTGSPRPEATCRSFRRRKIDAFLGFPPEPQELRARKIGRVILNTATDKALVAVFLLHVFGNRDFVRDSSGRDQALSAGDPQGRRHLRHRAGAAAQRLVDAGFTPGATTTRSRR